MATKRRRSPSPRRPAPDDPVLSSLMGVPADVAKEGVIDRLPCASVAQLARTERGARSRIASEAVPLCRALGAAVRRSRADIRQYVDLLFAHMARLLPDGWIKVSSRTGYADVQLYNMQAGNWSPTAFWENGCIRMRHAEVRPVDAGDVCPDETPEVRQQVNTLVGIARRMTRAHRGYVLNVEFAAPPQLGAASTSLGRVLSASRHPWERQPSADMLMAALHNRFLEPDDLRRALAQAALLATTMNASATTGIELVMPASAHDVVDATIDVDGVERLVGVPAGSLAWIDVAARLAALDAHDAYDRSLPVGDARRLFNEAGVDWRRGSLPPTWAEYP